MKLYQYLALGLFVLGASNANAGNGSKGSKGSKGSNNSNRVLNVQAESVTGWNRLLGQVRYDWDFLAPPQNHAGANTIGEHNPGGTEAIDLSPASPGNTPLASLVDPFLETVFPPFMVGLTNPATLNVPIRDTATIVSGDNVTRGVLPFMEDSSVGTDRTFAAPNGNGTVTLDEWFEGSGSMKIRCRRDGTAKLRMRMKGLLPNRVYTVWAMWHLADGRNFPQPYGGVPNAYVTDAKGDANFVRELNFCPTTASSDGINGNRLLSIITHIHSDHMLYGAVPFPGGAGFPPGSVGSMQLEWNFPGTGVRLID